MFHEYMYFVQSETRQSDKSITFLDSYAVFAIIE